MAGPFPWGRHQKLKDALGDQVKSLDTPLACIWGNARIGSYADRSRKSFSIDNEARIQAFTKCLNGVQKRNFDCGKGVGVLGYGKDGKRQRLELQKKEGGHAVLKGPWRSILEKNKWSEETIMCIWGFPYGERNSGEPRFVFTDNKI